MATIKVTFSSDHNAARERRSAITQGWTPSTTEQRALTFEVDCHEPRVSSDGLQVTIIAGRRSLQMDENNVASVEIDSRIAWSYT